MKGGVSILLLLVSLAGAQAGEVWKGTEKLSESEAINLLATAREGKVAGQPLAGIIFRHFPGTEFYDLVCKAEQKQFNAVLSAKEATKRNVKFNFDTAVFEDVSFLWLVMPRARFNEARFTDVVFQNCNLSNGGFERSEFIRAWFLQCDLTHVSFNGEDQSKGASKKQSERRPKKPSPELWFGDSNLTGCSFRFSWISQVSFDRSYLSKSDMAWAKFDSTTYDPMPDSHPFLPSFATFDGLPNFVYQTSPTGITELRNAFKSVGLRREEQQITAALCRQQMREGGPWEGTWKRVLFDLPSAFGMSPGRPLWILLCLCGIFTLPYTWAILRGRSKPGEKESAALEGRIWQVPFEKRVSSDDAKLKLLHVDLKKSGLWRGLWRALGFGFFFSLISAFGVGYKDLDVGRWIERINPDESTLRATGWLKTVSGVQGLLSFYLLVLWLLTYFGRPFE